MTRTIKGFAALEDVALELALLVLELEFSAELLFELIAELLLVLTTLEVELASCDELRLEEELELPGVDDWPPQLQLMMTDAAKIAVKNNFFVIALYIVVVSDFFIGSLLYRSKKNLSNAILLVK